MTFTFRTVLITLLLAGALASFVGCTVISDQEATLNLPTESTPAESTSSEISNDIFLYHGDTITPKPGIQIYSHSLNVNDASTQENFDNRRYHNYEDNKYLGKTTGRLEGFFSNNDNSVIWGSVQNVKRIATSTKINAFPREISEDQKIDGYRRTFKVDLDGNGTYEYLCVKESNQQPIEKGELQNVTEYVNEIYTHKYVLSIDLLNEKQEVITNLVTFIQYGPESRKELSHLKIDIMDIDSDGIMEILIDCYGYEQGGNVAIYKFDGKQVFGETNYETNNLP
ncbi:MAG: hypothetical protein FWG14_03170 [Peptococcaceae bacterium]|nr:hypothetical protein [Peptococcaceae bacterium]